MYYRNTCNSIIHDLCTVGNEKKKIYTVKSPIEPRLNYNRYSEKKTWLKYSPVSERESEDNIGNFTLYYMYTIANQKEGYKTYLGDSFLTISGK